MPGAPRARFPPRRPSAQHASRHRQVVLGNAGPARHRHRERFGAGGGRWTPGPRGALFLGGGPRGVRDGSGGCLPTRSHTPLHRRAPHGAHGWSLPPRLARLSRQVGGRVYVPTTDTRASPLAVTRLSVTPCGSACLEQRSHTSFRPGPSRVWGPDGGGSGGGPAGLRGVRCIHAPSLCPKPTLGPTIIISFLPPTPFYRSLFLF